MEMKNVLNAVGIIALIITSSATIHTSYQIHNLSEKETHSNLIISFVSYELFYSNSSNGFYDLLTIRLDITVHNTKRSDYPARIISVKNKISDESEQVIVGNNDSSIIGEGNVRLIDTGETKEFSTEIQMNLNKTGNYTTQTTIEYVDLKDNTLKYIDFYNEFELEKKLFGNQNIRYEASLKKVGDFNELWALGKYNQRLNVIIPSFDCLNEQQ